MHSWLKREESRIIHGSWLNENFTPILILVHDILSFDLCGLKLHVIFLKILATNHFDLVELLFVFLKCGLSLLNHIVDVLVNKTLDGFYLLGHEVSQLLLLCIDWVSSHDPHIFNCVRHFLHAFRIIFVKITKPFFEIFLCWSNVCK